MQPYGGGYDNTLMNMGMGGGGMGGGMSYPTRGRGRRYDHGSEDFTPRRRNEGQRPVDFFASAIHHVKTRHYRRNSPYSYHVPPHPYYCKDLLPCKVTADNPATAIATQWVNSSHHMHPMRANVSFTAIDWAPDGRRLLCAASNGEFYLFNGHSFGTEIKTAAHEDGKPIRALAWGKANDLIVSGGEGGIIKMWRSSLVNVAQFNSNQSAVREVSLAPGEAKFVTAGKDGSARIWDTNTAGSMGNGSGVVEHESKLEGHGSDVQSVHWHPYKALILSGSNDNAAKLWDPRAQRSAACLATLESHIGGIQCCRWNRNGYEMLTSDKSGIIKLWDLRLLREVSTFMNNHSKEVGKVAWHPTHSHLFASAGGDGKLISWIVDPSEGLQRKDGVFEVIQPAASIPNAHDKLYDTPKAVNTIAWSPMGHLLASAATEIKYWHRNKPGAEEETVKGDVEVVDEIF